MKLFYLSLVFSLITLFACNSNTDNENSKENSNLLSSPSDGIEGMIGVQWRCTKFINFEDNSSIDIKTKGNYFLFQMNTDGTFEGKTSSNSIFGKYRIIEDDQKMFLLEISGTEIMENKEGEYFARSLLSIESYHFNEKESVLNLLFNNNKNSLYFKENNDENK